MSKTLVSKTYAHDPFVFIGTQVRVWLASHAHEKRLAMHVAAFFDGLAEDALGAKLRGGFKDLGPDLDFALIEMQIHDLARRKGFATWDDEDLSRHLDRLVDKALAAPRNVARRR